MEANGNWSSLIGEYEDALAKLQQRVSFLETQRDQAGGWEQREQLLRRISVLYEEIADLCQHITAMRQYV